MLHDTKSSISSSPKVLNSDDCRRDDDSAEGAFVGFLIRSAHSFKLLISLPSTLIVRLSVGLPRTVPVYLVSSSVVVLCFFLSTGFVLESHYANCFKEQTSQVIFLRINSIQCNTSDLLISWSHCPLYESIHSTHVFNSQLFLLLDSHFWQ
jgi:hypothetical protein